MAELKCAYRLVFPRKTLATAWDPKKHPRGDPDNKGQFIPTDGSAPSADGDGLKPGLRKHLYSIRDQDEAKQTSKFKQFVGKIAKLPARGIKAVLTSLISFSKSILKKGLRVAGAAAVYAGGFAAAGAAVVAATHLPAMVGTATALASAYPIAKGIKALLTSTSTSAGGILYGGRKELATSLFDETEHPRGQPENKGEFRPKDAAAAPAKPQHGERSSAIAAKHQELRKAHQDLRQSRIEAFHAVKKDADTARQEAEKLWDHVKENSNSIWGTGSSEPNLKAHYNAYNELDEITTQDHDTPGELFQFFRDAEDAAKKVLKANKKIKPGAGSDELTAEELKENEQHLTKLIAACKAGRDRLRVFAEHRKELKAIKAGESYESDNPTMLATAHAPVGGIYIKGKFYAGGKFIPDEVAEQASAAQKAQMHWTRGLFDPEDWQPPHQAGLFDKAQAGSEPNVVQPTGANPFPVVSREQARKKVNDAISNHQMDDASYARHRDAMNEFHGHIAGEIDHLANQWKSPDKSKRNAAVRQMSEEHGIDAVSADEILRNHAEGRIPGKKVEEKSKIGIGYTYGDGKFKIESETKDGSRWIVSTPDSRAHGTGLGHQVIPKEQIGKEIELENKRSELDKKSQKESELNPDFYKQYVETISPSDRTKLETEFPFGKYRNETLREGIERLIKHEGHRVVLTTKGPALVDNQSRGFSAKDIGKAGMEYASFLSGKHEAKPESSQPKDQLPGGKADNAPDSAFDKNSLFEGAQVESEHTDDPDKAKEIAKDHLTEDKDYYDKLKQVEGNEELDTTPPVPSADRHDEVRKQLQDIYRDPKFKAGDRDTVNKAVDLERELEFHKPAAIDKAQKEIDYEKLMDQYTHAGRVEVWKKAGYSDKEANRLANVKLTQHLKPDEIAKFVANAKSPDKETEPDEPEESPNQPTNFDHALTIAADDIGLLRGADVHRVLDSMQSEDDFHGMVEHLMANRPDLGKQIADARKDISEERGYGSAGKSANTAIQSSVEEQNHVQTEPDSTGAPDTGTVGSGTEGTAGQTVAGGPGGSDGRRADVGRTDSGSVGGNDRGAGDRPAQPKIITARQQFTRTGNPELVPPGVRPHLNETQIQGASLAIDAMTNHGGFLLADGTGVGKTREQLAVAKHFIDQGKKVVIVSPAEVIKPDWKKGTMSGSFANDSATMGINAKLIKGDAAIQTGDIHVTTYNELGKLKDQIDNNTVLIFDESHFLKNQSSQRHKHGKDAMNKAAAVLYATATPGDKPLHMAHLFRANVFGNAGKTATYEKLGMELVDQHVGGGRYQKIWRVNPSVGSKEAFRRIAGLFDQMTKDGLMVKRELSMDGVDVAMNHVELTPEQHAEVSRAFDAVMSETNGNKAVALMAARMHQEPMKIPHTVKMIQQELAEGRSPVIFVGRVNNIGGDDEDEDDQTALSKHGYDSEGTAKALKKALMEAGIAEADIGELHGGATKTADQKKKAMRDFQANKTKVIIATIQSGGTGINLDDTVGDRPRTMIMMTPPFTANDMAQAVGRIHRLNTKSASRVYGVLSDTAVDEWNAGILNDKFKTLGAYVGGHSTRGKAAIDASELPDIADEDQPFEWGESLLPKPKLPPVKITGNTFAHKDALKAAGARWNANAGHWEINPANTDAVRHLKGLHFSYPNGQAPAEPESKPEPRKPTPPPDNEPVVEPEPEPYISPERKAAIHQAIRHLAGMDTDRARERNDVGFNQMDSEFGAQLAGRESLTDRQALSAAKMLAKYHRQIDPELMARVKQQEEAPPRPAEPVPTEKPQVAIKKINTQRGQRSAHSFSPDESFWQQWKKWKDKPKDKPEYLSVSKNPKTGNWEATIWGESDADVLENLKDLSRRGIRHPRHRASEIAMLATHHAPVGGIVIAGKKFRGGEFIPDQMVSQATTAQKARLEKRADLFDDVGQEKDPEDRQPESDTPTGYTFEGERNGVKYFRSPGGKEILRRGPDGILRFESWSSPWDALGKKVALGEANLNEPIPINSDMNSAKPPHEMTKAEHDEAIEKAPANSFVTTMTENWGSGRGQGKRIGGMVKGGMSDPPRGEKTYTHMFGKLPKEEATEAYSLEGAGPIAYAKARAHGFDHEHAMLVGYEAEDPNSVSAHKRAVENAIESGKTVPADVLKDYPDLAKSGKNKEPDGYKQYVEAVRELDQLEGGYHPLSLDEWKEKGGHTQEFKDEIAKQLDVSRKRKAEQQRINELNRSLGEFAKVDDTVYRRTQAPRGTEWKPVAGLGYPMSHEKMLAHAETKRATPMTTEEVIKHGDDLIQRIKNAADDRTRKKLDEIEAKAKQELSGNKSPQLTADEFDATTREISELKKKHEGLLLNKGITDRFKRALDRNEITPERYQELVANGTALSDEKYKAAQDIESQIDSLRKKLDAPLSSQARQELEKEREGATVIAGTGPPPGGWKPEDKVPVSEEAIRHRAAEIAGHKPWEMTRQEWNAKAGGTTGYNYDRAVTDAIRKGSKVPDTVLDQDEGRFRTIQKMMVVDSKFTPEQQELLKKKTPELTEDEYLEQQRARKKREAEHSVIHLENQIKQLGPKATKKKAELEANLAYWRTAAEKSDEHAERNREYNRRKYREEIKAAISKGIVTDPRIIKQHPEFEIARTARERYEKGLHTSFANRSVAVDESMKKARGYKAKQQDGKELSEKNKIDLERGVSEIEAAIGELKDLFDYTDITLAHTNGKHPFLSTSGGLYHSADRTVTSGTIIKSILGAYECKALAHEIGHWLDFEAGNALGWSGRKVHYSGSSRGRGKITQTTAMSDRNEQMRYDDAEKSALIQMATDTINKRLEAKKLVSGKAKDAKNEEDKLATEAAKVELGPYWTMPTEVWARLFEQYIGDHHAMNPHNRSHKHNYFTKPGYWDEPTWQRLKPLVKKEIDKRLDVLRTAAAKKKAGGS